MPKIPNQQRHLEQVGHATVFRSMSSSRPGLWHYTVVMDPPDGSVRCSCEGFCMHGHCWHLSFIPLCMNKGFDQECFYVRGHKGLHSWQLNKTRANTPEETKLARQLLGESTSSTDQSSDGSGNQIVETSQTQDGSVLP